MMRIVTIYGITSHQARAGSIVELYRMPPIAELFPIGPDDALMVEQEVARRLQLKVHTIRRSRRVAGVQLAEPWRSQDVEETYIAIEPELEELLMLPIKARLTEAEHRAEQQTREATQLRQRIEAFHALPWHQRLWAAIRRAA